MLTLRNLRVDYHGVVAVAGVDLEVREGEAVALVGANGAGKTSVLAAISGLHRPVGGSVTFLGREIAQLPAYNITPLGIALVPEGRRLFGNLSVHKNLLLGAYRQRNIPQRERDLDYVLDFMPVLRERLSQRTGTLSGGEQQMVAIGRALMSRPKLLMLDEPSLGIAPIVVARLFEALKRVRESGTTVLLVEQNLRMALEFSDRAYVMQTGRVVLDGEAGELSRSEDVKRAYLGL